MVHQTIASLSFLPIAAYAWCAYDFELNLDGQNVGHTAAPDKRDYRVDSVDPNADEIAAVQAVHRTVDMAAGSQSELRYYCLVEA